MVFMERQNLADDKLCVEPAKMWQLHTQLTRLGEGWWKYSGAQAVTFQGRAPHHPPSNPPLWHRRQWRPEICWNIWSNCFQSCRQYSTLTFSLNIAIIAVGTDASCTNSVCGQLDCEILFVFARAISWFDSYLMHVAVIFKCAMARVIGVPVNKVQELTDGSAFCFTKTLPRQPLSECRAK